MPLAALLPRSRQLNDFTQSGKLFQSQYHTSNKGIFITVPMSSLFAKKAVQVTVHYIGSEFDNLTAKLFKKLIISAQSLYYPTDAPIYIRRYN